MAQQLRTGVYLPPFSARGSNPSPAVRVVTIPSDSWKGTCVWKVLIRPRLAGQNKIKQCKAWRHQVTFSHEEMPPYRSLYH